MKGFFYKLSLGVLIGLCVFALPLHAQNLDALVSHSLQFAQQQLTNTVSEVNDPTKFPRSTRGDGSWSTENSGDWTSGFFPGCLWHMYDFTSAAQWKTWAQAWTAKMEGEKNDTGSHDVGFKIFCSFGNGYRLTATPAYKDVIIQGARSLATRFNPIVGCTRSWNNRHFPVIIDNMMNLEILFWASKNGGEAAWYDMAVSHALKTRENHVRPDGSTYHVVDYNPSTGDVILRETHQGYADESTWARGQAWAVYGFTMAYRETADARFLETAQLVSDYFINNLPADHVPFWDFEAPNIPNEEKDASAAAIAASGLLELSAFVADGTARARYEDAAFAILASLCSPAYLAEGSNSSGILLHAVGNHPSNKEIDVSLIYADYYFVEALLRYQRRNPSSFTLAVNTVGSGNVQLNPPGGVYDPGTVVTLTANAAADFQFSGWSGDLTGSNNPTTITMNANKNVTATFTPSGTGGVVVHEETKTGGAISSVTVTTSASLSGVSGNLYLAAISTRPKVTVRAVSGLGLTWKSVKAQCAGRNQTGVAVWMAQGTPNGNGAVSATLGSAPQNAVIAVSRYSGVAAVNSIGNLISGNTKGIDGACSGGVDNSSYSFNLATTVNGAIVYGAATMRNKTHTPGADFTERGEIIQSSGSSAASVAVQDESVATPSTVPVNGSFNGNIDWAMVAAEIKPQSGGGPSQFTLTISTVGSGIVQLNPAGGIYNSGTVVTLTANPAAGFQFSSWSGDLTGSTNPTTITMNANKNVTATFTALPPTQYSLTINFVGSGAVNLNPPGGIYNSGTVVTLTANPAAGFQFSSWSGDLTGSTNPTTITMNANKNVTATFTPTAPPGALLHEETKTGGATSSITLTTSASLSGVSGNLYLVAISTRPKVTVRAVSGLGLTWKSVKAQCAGRNQTGVAVWMAQGTPNGNGAVSATLGSAPQNAVIAVTRYSGVATVNPIGNIISGNTKGIDGACSGGVDNSSYSFNLTTTVNGAIVYCAAVMRNKTHTPGADFTERGEIIQSSGSSAAAIAAQDKNVASPSSVTVNGSFNGTVDWAVVAFEITPQSALPKQFENTDDLQDSEGDLTPLEYNLQQNYPNPFNPATTIRFELPYPALVTLRIYDICGREILTVFDHVEKNSGIHSVLWNGRESSGFSAPSGVYFYSISAQPKSENEKAFHQTKKMIFLK